MAKSRIILLVSLSLWYSMAFSQKIDFNNPPIVPQLLLPNFISTGLNERDLTISPDGKELYFTVVSPQNAMSAICYSTKTSSGDWTKPKIASFSGVYSDLEPAFSPDGKKLYFVSKRPVDGKEKRDFDIWFVEKSKEGWSSAKHLPINTDFDEFYPSVAANGNLYFTASYNEAVSKEDIFVSEFKDGNYQKAIALDSTINSKMYEFNAFVAPDESFILFTAYGRKGDKGRGDIYISFKSGSKWQIPKQIALINSEKLDYCPTVSFDKKILFFTSERTILPVQSAEKKYVYQDYLKFNNSTQNGNGDIYWISFEEVLKSLNKND
ncbi:MAG: hypothetical protein ACK4NY_18510 [Spirosomataceae bacterium]